MIEKNNFAIEYFEPLSEYLEDNKDISQDAIDEMKVEICEHLTNLLNAYKKWFPENEFPKMYVDLIKNPFNSDIDIMQFPVAYHLEIGDLAEDDEAKEIVKANPSCSTGFESNKTWRHGPFLTICTQLWKKQQ